MSVAQVKVSEYSEVEVFADFRLESHVWINCRTVAQQFPGDRKTDAVFIRSLQGNSICEDVACP